jgi:nitrate reductase gamma subunit
LGASPRADVARSTGWGLFVASLVLAGIYFGSRRLRDFDAALVPYAGASVFSAFGLGYRYSMWLTKPPTHLYWRRGCRLFFAPSRVVRNLSRLAALFAVDFVAQRFIEKRSPLRWAAHFCLAWGCVLAAAVTFPLSFGWVHFETAGAELERYRGFVFGVHVFSFDLASPLAPLVFNVLDISAVLVIAGVTMALWRRSRDRGELTVQQFGADLLPLVMLFAVSITGVFLTVSTHLMRGLHFVFLSQLHAVTVIFTLLYLPFGKFFHIFQRPAQLGVAFYREVGAKDEGARCARCGERFASRMHIEDLKQVERELGIRYESGNAHYQDVCPPCRRKNLALTQDALWKRGA